MRTPSCHLLPLTLAAVALASIPAVAQHQNNAGLGTVKRFYNASYFGASIDNVISGVAVVGGTFYITNNANPPTVTVVDNGQFTRSFGTPLAPTTGTLDLDTDGTVIFAASASGVIVFDTNGGTSGLTIAATNGPQSLGTNPIPVTIPDLHAVAFDPNGNGGNGSLFIGSKNQPMNLSVTNTLPIVEIDLSGTVLKTYPNANVWDAAGLTRDPMTGNLWCMHGGCGTATLPNLCIIELKIDRANSTLTATGNSFMGGNPATQHQGRCCAGICGIPGGDQHSYDSAFDIALLRRLFGDDYVFVHRIHRFQGTLGYDEAFMEASLNSTTLGQGPTGNGDLGEIKANDAVRWRIDPGTSNKLGNPAVTVIDALDAASVDGNNLPFFPELRTQFPFSPATILLFGRVGDLTGPVNMPANVLQCYQRIRWQGLYLDAQAPGPFSLVATNEISTGWKDESQCTIIVEAVGANSFNNITTSGFWRVIHKGGLPIQAVTFDWMAQGDVTANNFAYFDTDQNMSAGVVYFDAGNSTAGVTGTYRNNSDVTTGLVYDALNRPVHAGASIGANSGFMAFNGSNNGNGNNLKTIKFRFAGNMFFGTSPANPMVFEFDTDVDFNATNPGDGMFGLVITVELLGGKILKGELRPDPNPALMRSSTGW